VLLCGLRRGNDLIAANTTETPDLPTCDRLSDALETLQTGDIAVNDSAVG
jgi:hypothetical protein